MSHRRTLFDVPLGALARQRSNTGDISRALGHADRSPRIEQIEGMG